VDFFLSLGRRRRRAAGLLGLNWGGDGGFNRRTITFESSVVLDRGFVLVVVEFVVVMLLLLLLLFMRGTIKRSSSGCISAVGREEVDDAASLGLSEIHVFMTISDSLEAIELSIVSFT
jgi:hypothetical protein